MPAHGDSYNIDGTFPSRSKSAPTLWDNGGTHGLTVLQVYDRIWHEGAPLEAYQTPAAHGRGITLPHSHITHYLRGAADGTGLDASEVNAVLDITNLTMPFWFVWDHYWHVDPSWEFDTGGDCNFKRMAWGDGDFVEQGLYNYLSFQAGNDNFFSATAKPLDFIVQGTGGGGFLSNGSDSRNTDSMNANPCEGWIKESNVIRVSDTTGEARYYLYSDQGGSAGGGFKALAEWTTNTRWDTMSGTGRAINPNGSSFLRDRGPENWIYDADIYVDLDTTPARIYLTDNATFTSSSIFEIQPYTAWSTTQVTITVNQGKLPDGTAHIHLRDEDGGDDYIGTLTLGEGGGGGFSMGQKGGIRPMRVSSLIR